MVSDGIVVIQTREKFVLNMSKSKVESDNDSEEKPKNFHELELDDRILKVKLHY